MYYAVVENNKVINVIVADADFVSVYEDNNPTHQCIEYDEFNEDDTKVARIGEVYVDGKFIAEVQPIAVPQSLTPRQIRLVLTEYGYREQVETMIAQSTDYSLKDWWEYSLEYLRTNEQLLAMADALGLSAEQIDAMFIYGASV